jgi:hypothetical protein
MRWTGHVARIVERRDAYRVLVGKPEGRRPFEDEGADGNVMLKWVFKKDAWGRGLNRGCIDLFLERDWWLSLVNVVMNLQVHKMPKIP